MELGNGLGDRAIQDVIRTYPGIGEILKRFDIGCVSCAVGVCLLKDVVSIHGLTKDDEAAIQREITTYLTTQGE